SFSSVAKSTGIREVVCLGGTTVLQADDVIDFAAVESICLGDEAVFAQKTCAVGDCLTQFRTDPSSHLPDSDARALSRGASSAQFGGSDRVRTFRRLTNPRFFHGKSDLQHELSIPQTGE